MSKNRATERSKTALHGQEITDHLKLLKHEVYDRIWLEVRKGEVREKAWGMPCLGAQI